MLSTAHHQSLPALVMPKRMIALAAPAALFSGRDTASSMRTSLLSPPGTLAEFMDSRLVQFVPLSKLTSTDAVIWSYGRKLLSKSSVAVPATTLASEMAGVLMKTLNLSGSMVAVGSAVLLSSYASGSATMIVLVPRVNLLRSWLPSVTT